MLKVTWIAAAEAPSAVPSGLVNSAQTYCGLEIAIMQISPSKSWIQRVDAAGTASGPPVVVLLIGTPELARLSGAAGMQSGCQGSGFVRRSNRASLAAQAKGATA